MGKLGIGSTFASPLRLRRFLFFGALFFVFYILCKLSFSGGVPGIIADYSLPFSVPEDASTIPPYIHQSYNSTVLPEYPRSIAGAVQSWRTLNPRHELRLWNDTDCDQFVRRFHPGVLKLYERFPKNVMRADLWRYLTLSTYGGVYADIDCRCLKAIDAWAEGFTGVRAIVGVEFDASDNWKPGGDIPRQLQFTQWTMAAAPRHRLMQIVVDAVQERSAKHSLKLEDFDRNTVMELTGPAVWTDSIYQYLAELGEPDWRKFRRMQQPTQVGDLLMLPITAFNPTNWDGRGVGDPQACVEHLFLGSWKDPIHE